MAWLIFNFRLSDQCEMLNGAMIPIEGGFWST